MVLLKKKDYSARQQKATHPQSQNLHSAFGDFKETFCKRKTFKYLASFSW